LEVMKLLLDRGVNIHTLTNPELEEGEDPKTPGYQLGATALHYAASKGHLAAVKLLVEHGADLRINTKLEILPLHTACFSGTAESAAIVKLLLEHEKAVATDVNQPEKFGTTPLHYAIMGGRLDVCELLINKGADINKPDNLDNSAYCTPLHFAVNNARREIIDLLLTHKVNINVQSKRKYTPLHMAAGKGMADVVQKLLNAGADPKIQDINGQTAEDYATQLQIKEILRSFKKEGQ